MNRREALQEHLAAGRKVLGVLPGRYPRELAAALGLAHMELWDPPTELVNAPNHLQPFVCSVIQRSLEQIMDARGSVDAFLYPHLCDSVQNLFTIVRDCVEDPRPAHLFYPPRAGAAGLGTAGYLAGHLRELAEALGQSLSVASTDSEMTRAVQEAARANAALANLYSARASGRVGLSNNDFYALVRQGEYRSLAAAAELWEGAYAVLEQPERTEGQLQVVLSGLLPETGLVNLLDEHGVVVVEDDLLSCGRRLLRGGYPQAADPYEAAAAAFLAQPPCSSIASSVDQRGRFLQELVTATGAGAIIFHTIKFCEMELFDHPFLLRWLREREIPTVVLESELHQAQYGQMATRLEAFLEIIG